METWKKFEIITNKIKTGLLTLNTPVMKRVIAATLTGIINATTLTGCSFVSKPIQTPVIVSEPLKFDNIDDEIYYKQYFVDCVLDELTTSIEEDGNTYAMALKNRIMDKYITIKDLEDSMDANNAYSMFLTDEDISTKKTEIKINLNHCVEMIENNTNYIFGEHFKAPSKTKN